jgi:hypothetical protein
MSCRKKFALFEIFLWLEVTSIQFKLYVFFLFDRNHKLKNKKQKMLQPKHKQKLH